MPFTNPILPGFYPDPSVCRVGEDYYLTTSTFEWSPGCPVFHSRDLVNWRQIGNALTTQEQLPLAGLGPSSGVFAPTLRHHAGRFYLITTIVDMAAQTFRNFIVTAEDPGGTWSAPVVLPGVERIDPDIFFDDDGRVWISGNRFPGEDAPAAGGNREIWLRELDPRTLLPAGEPRGIWWGALQHAGTPEAPHIFKKDGWYWLLTAEGGTGFEHCVCVARSREVTGPYEGCPRNPILTHRHLGLDYPITGTGHADLVRTQKGEWWMVLLACRPIDRLSLLGRETFLAPVDWPEGDWPVVNSGKGIVEFSGKSPDLPPSSVAAEPAHDDFQGETLPPHWCHLFNPPEPFWETGRDGLRLRPSPVFPEDGGSPALLARRVRHHRFTAQTELSPPGDGAVETGMVLFQNHSNHLRLALLREAEVEKVRLLRVRKGEVSILAEAPLPPPDRPGAAGRRLRFRIEGKGLDVAFAAWAEGRPVLTTPPVDAGFLAAALAGGFTGIMTGVFASSGPAEASVDPVSVEFFDYKALETSGNDDDDGS